MSSAPTNRESSLAGQLARLGFRELCEIRILLDQFDQTAESSA